MLFLLHKYLMRNLLTNWPCLEPGWGPGRAGEEEKGCQLGWTFAAPGFQNLDAILRQLMFGLLVQRRAAKRHDYRDLESTTQLHSRQMVFLLRLCGGVGEWWEQ